jgi:hypothetical protein
MIRSTLPGESAAQTVAAVDRGVDVGGAGTNFQDTRLMRSALCDGRRPVANAIGRLKLDPVQSLPSQERQPPEFGN